MLNSEIGMVRGFLLEMGTSASRLGMGLSSNCWLSDSSRVLRGLVRALNWLGRFFLCL